MLVILLIALLNTVVSNPVRNPCENLENYNAYYRSEAQRNDISCWENIYNNLNDNSNYNYENVCVYAFEKHICNMIVYNNENYKNLPKKWCSHEYKNARITYEKKCSQCYFESLKEKEPVEHTEPFEIKIDYTFLFKIYFMFELYMFVVNNFKYN
tara:strand:- start:64 stop:528 length:465 start_codon:yes stop_codon:yes gene_type:complete